MNNLYYNKLPPHNYLVEELLLGSILFNTQFIHSITSIIHINSFGFEGHKLIYRNIIELYNKDEISPIGLIYALNRNKILQKIGGIPKIIEMIQQSQIFISYTKTNIYIEELIIIIHNNYIKRLMIQYGYNLIHLAYIEKLTIKQLYDKASQYLNYIAGRIKEKNIDNFNELIGNLLSHINYYSKISNKSIKNIYYGFRDLDILLNGLSKGDLIIISGRPSMGKTSLAINIASNLIASTNIGTCIFSLEMSSLQILYKFIAIASTISIQLLKSGHLNNNQWKVIQKICNELLKSQLYINDQSNTSINYISNTCKFIIKEKPYIKLIIIDYLQLIHINNSSYENRAQELSYITRQLKILAKNLNIPIIVLSQLNRNIENRINKKPLLSDLRESGCVDLITRPHIDIFNYTNIQTILQNRRITSIVNFSGNLLQSNYNKDFLKNIEIRNEYIFDIIHHESFKLQITHNHRLLETNIWKKENILLKNNQILKYNSSSTKYKILERNLLSLIQFGHFNNVYDIQMYQYLNFICNKIIIHNSIEQDADIVMMLHQNTENNHIKDKFGSKILDVIIAKNRNGPIGSIKLIFYPNNTIFHSLNI